ncbi:MAG: hypothetical protein U5L74_00815 [Ideonella sp.]|nr:hypothetical protein [Ideonella sp.]
MSCPLSYTSPNRRRWWTCWAHGCCLILDGHCRYAASWARCAGRGGAQHPEGMNKIIGDDSLAPSAERHRPRHPMTSTRPSSAAAQQA